MRRRRYILGAVFAAAAAVAAPASANDCTPAQVIGDPRALPEAWQQALVALVEATAREGQPWSCPDARITLIPPGDHGLAQLVVEDASGVRRRPVASPMDVVPLGEAMLARPFAVDAPANPPPSPPPRIAAAPPPVDGAGGAAFRPPGELFYGVPASGPTPRPPWGAFDDGHSASRIGVNVPPPPRPGPSLQVDVLAGSRFTGPTRALLMGAELRTTLAYERWLTGLVARYDTAIAYFQKVPDQFSLSSVSVGFDGGYRLLAAPFELTAAIEASLAVVFMGGQPQGQAEPDIDARVDMRLGARLGAAIPITRRLRAVCALGAEGVPEALFGERPSHHHLLPFMPGYMAGLSVGVEVVAIQ